MSAWIAETFVATTLLMLLVLAIRAPVRRAFGPGLAYALWLLPVLRMLLPPLPDSWREQSAAPVAAMSDVITYYVIDTGADAPIAAATGAAPAVPAIDWMLVAAMIWAAGAAAFLGYHLIAHGRFCSRLLSRARVDRTVAEGKVRVIETDAAHGPLAFGIWRKYVAFPRDFTERYDEQERALALAHELGHHVRGDLIANWVALIVLALHWFNPVAWRAFRAFRADQEMACDALVLAGREAALRHAYGRAIVKSAHGGAVSAACHLHTINEIKGRLRMLSKTRKTSPARIATGALGLGALSLAALGLTASGSQAAERLTSKVEAATGITLSQDAPAAPAEPEAPAPAVPATAPAAPEPVEAAPKGERRTDRDTVTRHEDDGKDDKKRRVVVINRPGVDVADIDIPSRIEIEAMMPDIRSEKCTKGPITGEMVISRPSKDGKKPVTIICTNRIEHMARVEGSMRGERARVLAVLSRDRGLDSALIGLRSARSSVARDTTMSAEAKAQALKGIDEALAEVQQERTRARANSMN